MKTEFDLLPMLQKIMARNPIVDLNDLPPANQMSSYEIHPIPGVQMQEEELTREDGSSIHVLCYAPADTKETLPALLWLHGGGYFAGAAEADSALCQQFAIGANCKVFAPNYRLAPVYPYPAGLEDCYTVLLWMNTQAARYHIDPAHIAVGGVSAGGGLTAALTLLARDRGGPSICFQMPLYPMLDDRGSTPSSHEILPSNFPRAWNRGHNSIAWKWYLCHLDSNNVPPYAAPARALDLIGLPPAYTCVGELDLFRDETITYVARLAQADVPVEFHLYPGCYHGFETASDDILICKQARKEYITALKCAFT